MIDGVTDVAISEIAWTLESGASGASCDDMTATLVTYIDGVKSDVNYPFATLEGTNTGTDLNLKIDPAELVGDEPGGLYEFYMIFTMTNFPGTATFESDTPVADTTVTRGCFNIDADDMAITCDGATDLQFYVPVGAQAVDIYLNSCTFNADYDGVCGIEANKYFEVLVNINGVYPSS